MECDDKPRIQSFFRCKIVNYIQLSQCTLILTPVGPRYAVILTKMCLELSLDKEETLKTPMYWRRRVLRRSSNGTSSSVNISLEATKLRTWLCRIISAGTSRPQSLDLLKCDAMLPTVKETPFAAGIPSSY